MVNIAEKEYRMQPSSSTFPSSPEESGVTFWKKAGWGLTFKRAIEQCTYLKHWPYYMINYFPVCGHIFFLLARQTYKLERLREKGKNRFSYDYLTNHDIWFDTKLLGSYNLLCSLRIALRKCRIILLSYDKSLIWDSAMRPPLWRVTTLKRKRLHPFALTNG